MNGMGMGPRHPWQRPIMPAGVIYVLVVVAYTVFSVALLWILMATPT